MAYFFSKLALPSALLLFVFAAGECAVRPLRKRNALLAALFASFALILVRADSLLAGWMVDAPLLFEWPLPLNFWIGPLAYLYIREAVGLSADGFASRRGLFAHFAHFAPGALVFLILIPNLLQPETIRAERIAATIDYLLESAAISQSASVMLSQNASAMLPGDDPYALLLPLGILHSAVYLGLIIRDMLALLNLRHLRDHSTVRAFLFVVVVAFVCSAMALLGVFSGRPQWMDASIGLLSTIPGLLYILQRRYPRFFYDLESLLQKERERARYQRSQLEGVNLELLERRLTQLMDCERVYVREDLTLAALAEMLEATPHQLSEYFNHIRKINFAGFVNAHRAEAARQLLFDDRKRSVLSIAYEVGFNSKSAFNEAFAKHFGLSPTQLRKAGDQRPDRE